MAVCNDASVSDGANGDSGVVVDGSDCYFDYEGENEMITVGLVWLGLSIVCGLFIGRVLRWSYGDD